MGNKRLNAVFIGGGPRSTSFWNQLAMNGKYEDIFYPLAVVEPNAKIAGDWRFKVDTVCSTLDEALKLDVDLALVLSPPSTHAGIAVKCLHAGIDTWSEVPMGLTLEELSSVIDAEKGNKGPSGHYFYGENYCWMPPIQFCAKEHGEGKFGEMYFTEGEYVHSVEWYMIAENLYGGKKLDPELDRNTTPTWRADFEPIKYGHAVGPSLYVLRRGPHGKEERPASVTAMGNMKMITRWNTQNFQICLVQTTRGTVGKYTISFVGPHHGRIMHSFWGTRALFESEWSWRPGQNFYYVVPPEKDRFPDRHELKGQYLTEADLQAAGVRTAKGGHGGGDTIMMESLLASIQERTPFEIGAVEGAEMTAVGICASQAIKERRVVEIPRFD